MRYSQDQKTKYPQQDMDELLIQFAAETIARVAYEKSGMVDLTFEEWEAPDEDGSEVERARQSARVLFDAGLLTWPEDTAAIEVSWFIDMAAPITAGPMLDEIDAFGRDAKAALAHAEACRVLGRPHRLYWGWSLRGHGGNTRLEVGER